MNNGQRFTLLVEELIHKDLKYKKEFFNFVLYLNDRIGIDKAFGLTISDIDDYFIYFSNSKIRALPILITHIYVLKALFDI